MNNFGYKCKKTTLLIPLCVIITHITLEFETMLNKENSTFKQNLQNMFVYITVFLIRIPKITPRIPPILRYSLCSTQLKNKWLCGRIGFFYQIYKTLYTPHSPAARM